MEIWNVGFIAAGAFFVAYFWGYNWVVTGSNFWAAVASEPLWFAFSALPAIYGLIIYGLIRLMQD